MDTTQTITIDGRTGEGGGQVLRSSLALSLLTGKPLQVEHIRAGRRKPGLMRQHLACVKAAIAVGGGVATGVSLGSESLGFGPGRITGGDFEFAVGSAGSVALVLQTVLVPLLFAARPSTVRIAGGTHAAWAPPFDFLDQAFLPQLQRLLAGTGGSVDLELERAGFYPAGGGTIVATIWPVDSLRLAASDRAPYRLLDRGREVQHFAMLRRAHLPFDIVDREWDTLRRALKWDGRKRRDMSHDDSPGPGNSVHLTMEFEHVTEVVSSFGAKGRGASKVAKTAADDAKRYLKARAPVGRHLADQLLLPLAFLGGGEFRTLHPTKHLTTNVDIVGAFLPDRIELREDGPEDWLVRVSG